MTGCPGDKIKPRELTTESRISEGRTYASVFWKSSPGYF